MSSPYPNPGGSRRPSSSSPFHHRTPARDTSLFTEAMRDRQARGKDPYRTPGAVAVPPSQTAISFNANQATQTQKMHMSQPMSQAEAEGAEQDEEIARTAQLGALPRKEGFEEQEQRGFALSVLDCPERLLMYAQARDDSIAGQRLKFTALMCGFRAEDKTTKEKT